MNVHALIPALLLLALLAGCGGQTAASPSPSPEPSPTESPAQSLPDQQLVDMALAYMGETAEMYDDPEQGYGFETTDAQLIGLEQLAGIHPLTGMNVEVYEMSFRLKPVDASKVVLAGGMELDGEGWLLQTGSMGSPCLVVRQDGDTYTLLGTAWTGDLALESGFGGRLGEVLMQWGAQREDPELVEAGRLTLCRTLVGRAELVLAPFTGSPATAGSPYADGSGAVWLPLAGYEKQEGQPMADQLLSSMYAVFTKSAVDDFFARWIDTPASLLLEREGVLYVRKNAAELLGWDYTFDLSTLADSQSQSVVGYLALTADGTGHGGSLIWRFNLQEEEDGTWRLSRYLTLCAEGWDTPVEFAILAGDEWFGLDGGAAPAALGDTLRVEYDYNNTYGDGGKWRFESYDGVTAARYESGDGTLNGVVTLEVTRAGLPDWRGVEVGDSLEEVMSAYPEAERYDGENGGFGLYFDPTPTAPGRFADFTFDRSGTLTSFVLKNAFD